MACHEKGPLACHSERSEESQVRGVDRLAAEILRCTQNDMSGPVFYGVLVVAYVCCGGVFNA
jgi:hypothetical protein